MSETNEETPRYVGGNWDEPVVKVKRQGDRRVLQRKVVTKGVRALFIGGVLKEAKVWLRRGYEVRLCDEHERDAIRIYPLADKECKTMYPQAATMGDFRKYALVGKVLRVKHGDREISDAETGKLVREQESRHESTNIACVTPDTVVKCPNCGIQFRVGKTLAASK